MVITDAESILKRGFEHTNDIIKLKHHVLAIGNHYAMIFEQLNLLLNSYLLVLNINGKSNRIFFEGSMLCM